MAVSLDDAWDDPMLTSARKARMVVPPENHENDDDDDDISDVKKRTMPPQVTSSNNETSAFNTNVLLQHLKDVLYQFETYRRESSRRCSIYIIVAGILFALLFTYVDKLSREVKMLNCILRHRSFQEVGVVPAQHLTRAFH